MIYVFIPEKLNLEEFIAAHPPDFKYHLDYFKYIISLITEIPGYNKKLLTRLSYVPINSNILQSKVRTYNLYLDYLVQYGVLETDGYYIPEEKAQGYRFTKSYDCRVKIEELTKYTLVKSLQGDAVIRPKIQKKYGKLRKWFNENLEFDFAGAEKYLVDELNINIQLGDPNAFLKFNAAFMAAYKMSKGDYFFKVDDNVHRLHHNISIMKSSLRHFITYKGQKLVAVDICNSQPYLSSVLMEPKFFESSISGSDFLRFQEITHKNSDFTNINKPAIYSSIMAVKSMESPANKGFQTYVSHAQNGLIYEYIQEQLEASGIAVANRKQLKEIVFTVLFTDNRYFGQKDARPKRIFKNLFPEVYKVFAMVKQKDSTALPRLLQTLESTIILDRVAFRITKERPELPVYTIHDSIVTVLGEEGYVKKMMEEEFSKAIGYPPHTKYEYWGTEKADKKIKHKKSKIQIKNVVETTQNRMIEVKTPITLPLTLKKNGYDYTQVCRGSRSCIYEQRVSEKTKYYEVFLIRLSQEKLLPNGKILPVKEKFPSDEDFGLWAWTYPSLQSAQRKFNELEGATLQSLTVA